MKTAETVAGTESSCGKEPMPDPCQPVVLKGIKEDQTSQYLFR
jgi:hypothetical protein